MIIGFVVNGKEVVTGGYRRGRLLVYFLWSITQKLFKNQYNDNIYLLAIDSRDWSGIEKLNRWVTTMKSQRRERQSVKSEDTVAAILRWLRVWWGREEGTKQNTPSPRHNNTDEENENRSLQIFDPFNAHHTWILLLNSYIRQYTHHPRSLVITI